MMEQSNGLGFTVAFAVLAAAGCGGDEGSGDVGTVELTLVDVLATDANNPVATPHEIYLLDTATGMEVPGFEDPIMSEAVTGKVTVMGIPEDVVPTWYVVGNPDATPATYDAVSLNTPLGSGETLLRISNVQLANTAEQTGSFTPRDDRANMGATVYWTPGGLGNLRQGTIGCAEVYLDDNNDAFDEDADQRYNADNGLPTRPENQAKTGPSGRFYFGNIAPGEHTVRVTLDEGKSFIGEATFNVPFSRAEALGGQGLVIYLLGVDVDAETNPTPETCPGVYGA